LFECDIYGSDIIADTLSAVSE